MSHTHIPREMLMSCCRIHGSADVVILFMLFPFFLWKVSRKHWNPIHTIWDIFHLNIHKIYECNFLDYSSIYLKDTRCITQFVRKKCEGISYSGKIWICRPSFRYTWEYVIPFTLTLFGKKLQKVTWKKNSIKDNGSKGWTVFDVQWQQKSQKNVCDF